MSGFKEIAKLATGIVFPSKVRNLSPREHQVCVLLLKGLSYKEIALELIISSATVKNHVTNVLRKLGVTSTQQLFTTIFSDYMEDMIELYKKEYIIK
jgi:DNA-binding NarL/FixJ family response regulator